MLRIYNHDSLRSPYDILLITNFIQNNHFKFLNW